MTDRLHDRLTSWHTRVRAAMAGQRLDLPFAVAIMTEDLRDVYDLNLMVVVNRVPAQVLLRSIERLADASDWAHRRIEVDDPTVAGSLRAPLTAAGYIEERLVTMALRDAPTTVPASGRERSPRSAEVAEVAEHEDLARAVTAQEPWAHSEALVDQMMERERRLVRVTGARAIVAPPEAPVSRCLLLSYPSDGIVEIDAVSTLVEHRGQGWSHAVVRRAIAAARVGDAAHIMLVAAEGDWPKTWYERLGFRVVGRSSSFHRDAA